nr:hypothetical protein [Tanacetum cinerariifolium]
MADMTGPTSQAPIMAPLVRINDQILPRIRWVQTGYLKFSAEGSKREVFGMPIPGSLITADLREASYYQEYLANVTKHRRFLVGETGSVQDSPTPKPAKHAKKPKSTAQKARINILQYLIHLRMCKDFPTKMMKMFLLVENLRQQNPNNHEVHIRNHRKYDIVMHDLGIPLQDTMADMTAPTSQEPTMAPPVRTNDQILPRIRWVQIRYLKFSAKASYYREYLANVTKHRRFLVGETGSVQDSPTPKPAKRSRKPKSTAQKAQINIL